MDKAKKIREVMQFLDMGKTVKIDTGILWESRSIRGYKIINWRHYGQSANRRNVKELTFIINHIFDKKNKDFTYSL